MEPGEKINRLGPWQSSRRLRLECLITTPNYPLGQPFTSKELIGLGEESNIRKVLERLVKEEEIIRVTRGIYVRPKISRYVGRVPPSLEAVLETISTSTGEVFQVHGAEAVRQLGLSTQVPVKPLFLTNGRSRILSIGNIEVKLRKVSQRKLILAGTLAGIAVSAFGNAGVIGSASHSLTTVKRIFLYGKNLDERNIRLS